MTIVCVCRTLLAVWVIIGVVAWTIIAHPVAGLIAAVLLVVLLLLFSFVSHYGARIRSQGQRPFDPQEHGEQTECKFVHTKDGRVVEYAVFGSTSVNAKVLVQCCGSSGTARGQARFEAKTNKLKDLNLKGIALSYPGYAYSDDEPGRHIATWPANDLTAVLEAEGVDQFMVEGYSFGAPHAMAAAWHFGDRCLALGVMVPSLPGVICKECGLVSGGDYILRQHIPCYCSRCQECIRICCCYSFAHMRRWYGGWHWTSAHFTFWNSKKGIYTYGDEETANSITQHPACKKYFQAMPEMAQALVDDNNYLLSRGIASYPYANKCGETQDEWGFDPRDIECKRVAVWYAADDSENAPEHGKWLADMFAAKEGVKTNIRCEAGYDHLTFAMPSPENNLPKALLEMCEQDRLSAQETFY